MNINFISIGGWCGTKVFLKQNGYEEASYPFDYVRSSIEGVINCIETNFENYFPKVLERKQNYEGYNPFLGKYIGFYYQDLNDQNAIDSLQRKINRFNEKLSKPIDICFLRTICRDDYRDETKYYKELQYAINERYPDINYIIVFLIPNQDVTQYYKELDNKTFIFALNDLSRDDNIVRVEHKLIYDYIKENNLFINIPEQNNIEIIERSSRFWLIAGKPMIDVNAE
jgi:hypothetical protein